MSYKAGIGAGSLPFEPKSPMRLLSSGVDLTFANLSPGNRNANAKSETSLETYICWRSFDSNICESASQIGMQMLESDH
jgi:hypothetical protein